MESDKAPGSPSGSCFVVHGGQVQQGQRKNPLEIGVRRRSFLLPLTTQRPMLSDVEIGSLLGRGAYGYVYLGKWLSANVAIKVSSIPPTRRFCPIWQPPSHCGDMRDGCACYQLALTTFDDNV